MPYDCIVIAKQVPDTKNVTGKAMKDDGTVNRAALPAIFNPEDLNALEMALDIRDRFGGTVTVVTMGPPAACELLRDSLYRGADRVVLLTDRRFAAADTLATSYALSCAIRKIGKFDLIIGGRQAIDGDTAQVGPQTAEKMRLNQVTYVEKVQDIRDRSIDILRSIDGGYEVVRAKLPILLTVTGTANEPRPPRAKRILQYRHHTCPAEITNRVRKQLEARGREPSEAEMVEAVNPLVTDAVKRDRMLTIWDADAVGADHEKIGGRGSPTKVKKIESVVFKGRDLKWVEATEDGAKGLMKELVTEHILG
jgi:electron transfer flavoprotein beta subunit